MSVIWAIVNNKNMITVALKCVFEVLTIHQVLSELMNRESEHRILLSIAAHLCIWRSLCPQGWKIASKESTQFLCYDRKEKRRGDFKHTYIYTHIHSLWAGEVCSKNHRLSSCVYCVLSTWRTIFSRSTPPLILPPSQIHHFSAFPLKYMSTKTCLDWLIVLQKAPPVSGI